MVGRGVKKLVGNSFFYKGLVFVEVYSFKSIDFFQKGLSLRHTKTHTRLLPNIKFQPQDTFNLPPHKVWRRLPFQILSSVSFMCRQFRVVIGHKRAIDCELQKNTSRT